MWNQMQAMGGLPEPLLNLTLQYSLVLCWLCHLDYQPHENKSHSKGICTAFRYSETLSTSLRQEG